MTRRARNEPVQASCPPPGGPDRPPRRGGWGWWGVPALCEAVYHVPSHIFLHQIHFLRFHAGGDKMSDLGFRRYLIYDRDGVEHRIARCECVMCVHEWVGSIPMECDAALGCPQCGGRYGIEVGLTDEDLFELTGERFDGGEGRE